MKTKTNKTALIPKLRFPEFKNTGVWEVKKLGDMLIKNTRKNKDNKYHLIESVSNKYGFVKQDDFFDKRVASKDTRNYYVIDKGTFAYNPSRIDVGSLAYKDEGNVSIISPLYVSFKVNNDFIIDKYLLFWFKTEDFAFQRQLFTEGGVRNTLSFENLKKIKLPLPTLPEQQKIADFLSNLDEWIAAEEEKLTLLETYKKGLLQNLFPAEGQTVPHLRFPEFQNSGAWEVKRLGEVGEFFGGGTPSTNKAEYWEGNVPWISSSDIHEDDIHNISINKYIHEKAVKATATKIIPKGSLLFVSRVGVGKLAVNKVELCTSQDFANFVPKKNISIVFLGYYWLSKKHLLISLNQGTSIKGFTKGDLETLKFSYPHDLTEQQKIADCLSALDEQIDAQRQKIELLQQHKKGLLQNLFPSQT